VDWSADAIGAVLSQMVDGVERPISFQSRLLRPAEKKYSPTEREALAAVWGVCVFRPYVQGHHFTLQTDCSSLTWLKDHIDPPPKLARWLMKLSEFTFDIQHRSGKHNADALSCLPPAGSPASPAIMERPFLPQETFLADHSVYPPTAFMILDASPSHSPPPAVGYGSGGAPPVEEGGRWEGLGQRKTQAEDTKLAQAAGCKNHAAKRLRLSRAVASNAERVIPPSETEASLEEQRSSSVPADATCVVCEKEGDPSVLLICDACQNMTHITCERPPLTEVPAGPWECSVCKPPKATRFAGPVDVLEDMAVMNFLLNGECDISAGDSLARVKKRSSKYQLWQGEMYLRANATRDRRLIPTKDRRLALIQSCHRDPGHYGIQRTESITV
jgi:hypothetical protein